MAIVAIGVLILALVISGSRTGTIVVERIAMSFTTSSRGRTIHPRAITVTAITESSASGIQQRSFTSTSVTRPGFEQVYAGDRMQLYDPIDNTVYATTLSALQRASVAQIKATAPKGATVDVGVGKVQAISANSVGYVPGRTSVYEQWLRDGSYKLVGRETVDGRAALKLVEASPSLPVQSTPTAFESTTTVYVSPGSYDPIETVNTTKLSGIRTTSVERWQTYRALDATPANRRLVSLTARHPQARIVDDAMAFLRASQSEIRTTTVRTG